MTSPLHMKLMAPMSAASGWSARTRRNQYVARPMAATFRMAISANAHATGTISATQLSGNSSALCGLAKKGLPANTCGFQSGIRPCQTSLTA